MTSLTKKVHKVFIKYMNESTYNWKNIVYHIFKIRKFNKSY